MTFSTLKIYVLLHPSSSAAARFDEGLRVCKIEAKKEAVKNLG
jgi:hypothetical protein